jgi:long-chain acyl-CoA synthetase
VRKYLARFKAPKSVEFRSEFPKGGTGKILKQDLRREYWANQGKKVQ